MAFWIASPIMDPQAFVLTAAEIGLDFAIAKTLVAIGLGLVAGFGTLALVGRGLFTRPLRPSVAGGCVFAFTCEGLSDLKKARIVDVANRVEFRPTNSFTASQGAFFHRYAVKGVSIFRNY